jgi:GTPase SAR1 family protein
MQITLLGSLRCGKTSLMRCLANEKQSLYIPTIGADKRVIGGESGKIARLDQTITPEIIIWDTSGDTKYHHITAELATTSDIIIFCYEPNEYSFQFALQLYREYSIKKIIEDKK